MKFRKLRSRDIPALLELEERCFEESWRLGEAEFRDVLEQPFVKTCMVAVDDDAGNKPVGYVMVQRGRPFSDFDSARGQEVNIQSIAVDPAYQKQGVAAELMQALEEALPLKWNEEPLVVTAEVMPGNKASGKLFLKCSFAQVATKEDFYGPGAHAECFEKPLPFAPKPA